MIIDYISDQEIINYINKYYYNCFVLGIVPSCDLPEDEEGDKDDDN